VQRAEAVTVIHAGTLLAFPGQQPRRNASVVIRGNQIAEVRDGFVDVPGARVVDLRTHTVLPGLIDSHVHFRGNPDDRLQARLQETIRDNEDYAFTALIHAKRTLLAGFTTVRELGNDPRPHLSRCATRSTPASWRVRPSSQPAPASRSPAGTTIRATGATGTCSRWPISGRSTPATGPADCRRAVRQQIALGADVIKFASTGGVLSNVAAGLWSADDAGRDAGDRGHRRDVRPQSRGARHGVDGVNAALAAGVNSIEHGTFTNDETFRLYRQTGATSFPTMMAPVASLADGARGALTPAQYEKAREAAGNVRASLARAVRENVNIAFGTDSGVSRHGDNGQEFALMVDAGMTPLAAIRAATVNAATLLGRQDRIGTIEPGKDADLIAVAGDPLQNIRLLENVQFVMRHGRVHKLGGERQLTDVD
jgi:imidazolonepropionase-like amidohydrolase